MTHEIAQKATRGVGWNYVSYGLSKGLSFVIVSILAHLLTPDYFGLVALATLAIEYLSVFNDFGLGMALIQRREDVEITADIVFTLNMIVGIVLTIITYLISPLASTFFHEPSLTPILRWLGLTFAVTALGSVHKARLQRDLEFKLKVLPEFGNTLFKGVISISLALAGFGVWALVFGQLAGACVSSILFWIVVPWKPRFVIDRKIAGELFRFGLPIMAESGLSVFGDSFDYFLIGRYFTSAALGIYTLAYRLPEMLVIKNLWLLAAVMFPAYASVQEQYETLRKGFLATIRYLEIILMPICLGMLVAADPIVRVAFGEQWLEAIPIMRVLSAYVLIYSIGFHVGDVYKAIGRPDILIKLSIPVFIIRVIALWIGTRYGLMGVAFGHLTAGTIEVTLRMIVTVRVVKVSIKEIFSQLTSLIGGAFLLLLAVPTLVLTANTSPLVRLISVTIAGAVGYIGVMWFIEKKTILKAIQLVGIPALKKIPVE